MEKRWWPQSVLSLREGYSWQTFKKDLIAGLTIAVISIPLAMAFAIASGVTPDRGLFTAMVAGFLISALGGSRYQIGGPTGAFVVILYGVVQQTGYEGLALSGLVAAFLIVLAGVLRLGTLVRHVPHALVTGFTAGIAVIVFSSQVKDFLGLAVEKVPADFVEKWTIYVRELPSLNGITTMISFATLGGIIALRRFFPKIPWGASAIAIVTLGSCLLQLPIETVYSRFGDLPRALPIPALPSFALLHDQFWVVLRNGVSIAFLGVVESLLSAVIADRMTGTRHRSNNELVGQGIANFASIVFGGIPATGAIARTAANVRSGAETPMAGMISGVAILLILLFCAPIVSLVPLGALAAVLVMVAWNMSERHEVIEVLRGGRRKEIAVMVSAFFLTIFADIIAAVIVGMMVSVLPIPEKVPVKVEPSESQDS